MIPHFLAALFAAAVVVCAVAAIEPRLITNHLWHFINPWADQGKPPLEFLLSENARKPRRALRKTKI